MENKTFFIARSECPQLCKKCRCRLECSARVCKQIPEIVTLACEAVSLKSEFRNKVYALDYDELENIPLIKYAHFLNWYDRTLKATCERSFLGLSIKCRMFISSLSLLLSETCDSVFDMGCKHWKFLCNSKKSITDELRAVGLIHTENDK